MDKHLIILALETLKEQVYGGTDWSIPWQTLKGQVQLDRIDEQIDLMKSGYVIKTGTKVWVANVESYAKQYALDLFEQYLDGEKTIAEISQELKQE